MSENALDLESAFQTVRDFIVRVFTLAARALQHWPIVVVAAMIGVGAGYVAPILAPPIYESQAVVLYEETVETETLTGNRQVLNEWRRKSSAFRDALTSRSQLGEIITEFGLYQDTLKSKGMVDAVEEFRKYLNLGMHEGQSISLSYRANDPQVAQKVLQRLVEELQRLPNLSDAEQAATTKRFLDAQLERIANDLKQKESELAMFLSQHPEFVDRPEGEALPAPVAQPEHRGNSRLAVLRRERARLQQQLSHPGEAPAPAAAPSPPQAPALSDEDRAAIRAAETAVARASDELRNAEERFTEKHPDVSAARQRLAAAKAKLDSVRKSSSPPAATTPPPASLPAAYAVDREALERRLAEIDRAIAVERRSGDSPPHVAEREPDVPSIADSLISLEAEHGALQRAVATARDQYEQVQRRQFSAATMEKLQASGGTGRIVVVDPPLLPERPSARGPRTIAALGFGGVVFVGMVIAFLLTLIDDRVYDGYDIRRLKLGPIAQLIPPFDTKKV